MDSLDGGLLVEELTISFCRGLQDSRVWVRLPAWIRIVDHDFCSSKLKDGRDHLSGTVTEARRGATLARLDDDLTIDLLDRGQVV